MRDWKNIATFYSGSSQSLINGTALALLAALSAVLLTVISGWFITATALAGVGILSLQTYNLFLPSAAIRFLALGRPVSKYFERLYNHKITLRLVCASRSRTFAKFLKIDKSRLIAFRGTDLAGTLTTDIDQMDQFFLGFLLPFLTASIIVVIAIVILFFTCSSVAVLMALIFLICGIFIPFLSLKSGLENDKAGIILHNLQAKIADYATGHQEMKVFGIFERSGNEIRKKIKDLSKERRYHHIRKSKFSCLQSIFLELAIGGTLIILYQNHLEKTAGPAVVLVIFAVVALTELLQPLPEIFFSQALTFSAGRRLSELDEQQSAQSVKTSSPRPMNLDIAIENLSFSYGKRLIYQNLTISFQENKTHIIHGPNGSGKSTLFDLISGLQTVGAGSIKIGGIDNRYITNESRSKLFAYMEQHLSLFDCSIYKNIAIGKTGAGPGEIIASASRAGLDPMTELLADGIFSPVEEDHRNISGGQARMICLARVILKDAPIVLLDEPTEGFDEAATSNFIDLINSWKGKKTVIIITHRETPLLQADRRYLLEAGTLIPIK